MKANEEETEERVRVTNRQDTNTFLGFFWVCGPLLLRFTVIMSLKFIRYLTELATVSLTAQHTEN